MDLVALTLAILTALGLEHHPCFEQSLALVGNVVREARAAGVVRRLRRGHDRCGLWSLSAQYLRTRRCRGAVGFRRTLFVIRDRIAPALESP